jgi:lauroyl/myristoyl acyltransferase
MRDKNYASWLLFKYYLTATLYAPESLNNFASKLIFTILIPVLKKAHSIALLNMMLCFKKSINQQQRKSLAKQSLQFSMFSARQVFSLLEKKKSFADFKVQFMNQQFFADAIQQKGSAIIASGHLGVFPLIPLYLAHKGYPIDVVIKPPHNIHTRNFIYTYMRDNSIGIIPTTPEIACYKMMCSSLQNRRLIMIMVDQTPMRTQSHITTTFFGLETIVYPTIAALSKKFRIPIIPLFTYYDPGAQHSPYLIKSYSPLHGLEDSDPIARVHELLEKLIRTYPWQWWWHHKKWYNLIDYNNPYYYRSAYHDPDKLLDTF